MNAFSWLPGAGEGDPNARDAFAEAENAEMVKAAALAQKAEARLFLDVFTVGRGPELLELMQARTLELDLMTVSTVIGRHFHEAGVGPAEWAYHRNGQNSVVRWIIEQIRLAKLIENQEAQNV